MFVYIQCYFNFFLYRDKNMAEKFVSVKKKH